MYPNNDAPNVAVRTLIGVFVLQVERVRDLYPLHYDSNVLEIVGCSAKAGVVCSNREQVVEWLKALDYVCMINTGLKPLAGHPGDTMILIQRGSPTGLPTFDGEVNTIRCTLFTAQEMILNFIRDNTNGN